MRTLREVNVDINRGLEYVVTEDKAQQRPLSTGRHKVYWRSWAELVG